MKKLFLFLSLMMACVSAYSQKSYINLYVHEFSHQSNNYDSFILSGDVPQELKSINCKVGEILNRLSQLGYEVEFMCAVGTGSTSSNKVNYLLSRGSASFSRVQSISSDDSEVKEVARYNLQGRPVNKNEKGIQIIVYSNYTTKTVIIE